MRFFVLVAALALGAQGRTVQLEKMQQIGLTDANGQANFTNILAAGLNTQSKFAASSRQIARNVKSLLAAPAAALLNSTLVSTPEIHRHRIKRASAALALNPYSRDVLWTGIVSVGTPSQVFVVDFDTGSGDFVLVRSTCAGAGCTVNGAGAPRRQYDTSKSSSWTDTGINFSNTYVGGSSSTSGKVVKDVVHFGRLSATAQAINAATTVGGPIQALYADGLLGLGFPALSSSGMPSLSFTLANQHIIGPQVFGFRLSSTRGVSELDMGFLNSNKFTGTTALYPMGKDPYYTNTFTYFQTPNSIMSVNGNPVSGTMGDYIFDSGTTLIVSPVSQAQAFWSAVPNSAPYSGAQGYYTWPCNQSLSVTFSFNGQSFKHGVAAADFNLGYVDVPNGRCLGALVGLNLGLGTRTIVGDVFMKSWYTSFNLNTLQIGLAKPV